MNEGNDGSAHSGKVDDSDGSKVQEFYFFGLVIMCKFVKRDDFLIYFLSIFVTAFIYIVFSFSFSLCVLSFFLVLLYY